MPFLERVLAIFSMKEWLECCMDVCSSYNSDIGFERLSEIAIIILSLKFIGSFEAAAFSFANLFFLPSHFSLLSSSHSLCCLPQFAPTDSRKNEQRKNSLDFERNTKHY